MKATGRVVWDKAEEITKRQAEWGIAKVEHEWNP